MERKLRLEAITNTRSGSTERSFGCRRFVSTCLNKSLNKGIAAFCMIPFRPLLSMDFYVDCFLSKKALLCRCGYCLETWEQFAAFSWHFEQSNTDMPVMLCDQCLLHPIDVLLVGSTDQKKVWCNCLLLLQAARHFWNHVMQTCVWFLRWELEVGDVNLSIGSDCRK